MSEKVYASFLDVADLKELVKGIYELEVTASTFEKSTNGNYMYKWVLQPTDSQFHSNRLYLCVMLEGKDFALQIAKKNLTAMQFPLLDRPMEELQSQEAADACLGLVCWGRVAMKYSTYYKKNQLEIDALFAKRPEAPTEAVEIEDPGAYVEYDPSEEELPF